MNTIGDGISRVRNVLKAVKEDPFMTDRFIYSLILKYAKTLMERDSKKVDIFKNSSLFREIPCIEMIEVDKVEACCGGIKTKCTFMRSKNPLPPITALNGGYLIKHLTSIDYSADMHETQPYTYTNMTKSPNFKYNTHKYFWIVNNYIYAPNISWEMLRLSAMFEEDVSQYDCGSDVASNCVPEQERSFGVPEHLFSEIEQLVRQEILTAGQIPSDGSDDSQNAMR